MNIRRRATDDLAHEIVARIKRGAFMTLGLAIVGLGIAIAPLPGPGGLPVTVLGLMIVLRNSFKAKRVFVRVQKKHPKMVFPIRRLLRREPEFMPVFWQQFLRVERLLMPRRFRAARKVRLGLKRRFLRLRAKAA